MKQVTMIHRAPGRHWVGDGFPVQSVFTYDRGAEVMSPFLLLDYAGPAQFPPTREKRGVGDHPHRGFETVTLVYSGEVEHRDSSGAGGRIGRGDVQWMTAASGVVHQEYHGEEFARRGGRFELVQLWVNLPARHKMDPPAYQGIPSDRIPLVELPDGAGSLRVIAGRYEAAQGPARTFTPVHLWDLRLKAGSRSLLRLQPGYTTGVFVLRGKLRISDEQPPVSEAELAVLEREGDTMKLEALAETTLLVLHGEPIPEPVVGYGPFVMNTQAEIRQAFLDYQAGRMGQIKG